MLEQGIFQGTFQARHYQGIYHPRLYQGIFHQGFIKLKLIIITLWGYFNNNKATTAAGHLSTTCHVMSLLFFLCCFQMPTHKCFTSGEGFWSQPELHAHLSRQHPAISDEVQCRWCMYTCHWRDRFHLLAIHVRRHHPGHQAQHCKGRQVSSLGITSHQGSTPRTFAHQRPEVVADRSGQRRHYAPIIEELDQAYLEWLDLPQQHPTLGVEDWDTILDGPVTPPSPHVVCEEPPASQAGAMPSSPASTVGYSHPTAPQPYVPLTSRSVPGGSPLNVNY